MAKKVDNELADPYQRIISKVIPPVNGLKAEVDSAYTTLAGSEWVELTELGLGYESTIDLSGYANQYLTFFPEVAFNQGPARVAITGTEAAGVIEAVAITTVPMDLQLFANAVIRGGGPGLPSLLADPDSMDYSTALYYRVDTHLVDTATPNVRGVTRLANTAQLGSISATAADKLFIYKVVLPIFLTSVNAVEITSILSTAERVGFIGQMAEEPTIEYMMRLKRSYELANQV